MDILAKIIFSSTIFFSHYATLYTGIISGIFKIFQST